MSGKSIFLSIFSKYIEKQKKSILIIDTCEENNINFIFNIEAKENIQKVSKKISYILYKILKTKNNYINLEKIIKENKKEFDYILVDTNSNINSEFYKNLKIFSDYFIVLIEPNLMELEKSEKFLEVYKYDLKIPNSKIKIVFNKVNKFQIGSEVLKELFSEYEILGCINYSSEYNLFINKHTKYLIEDNEYKKIFEKFLEKERNLYGANN